MFIGRVKELMELMRCYKRKGVCVLELYAPENAGKTALLEEFCRNKEAVYFTAEHVSGRANLAGFSDCVLSHYKDKQHKPFMFWSNAFTYITNMQQGRKIIVVLDRFDELTDRDPVFMEMLCKCIASIIKGGNMLLILSGRKKLITGRSKVLLRNVSRSLALEKFALTDEVIEQLKRDSANDLAYDGTKMLRCSEDDVILREGEVNPEMYKIISGRALCYLGYGTDYEYLVGTLKDGQTFGEYSLLTNKPEIYTVIAYTDTLLLRIGHDEFTRFVEMNANNSIDIMKNMARMLNVLKINIDMLREESGGKP